MPALSATSHLPSGEIATVSTGFRSVSKVNPAVPHRSTSHTTICPSLLPAAATVPSGATATLLSEPTFQVNRFSGSQVSVSHTTTVASLLVVNRYRLLG